ncbi:MAG TPA: ABC transporter ATP-binding protein [Blastocatellia bacterium]|jgi:NitT/TauT family transport system ATP-binding protein
MTDKLLYLDNVSCWFGSVEVLRGITLDIYAGEFVAVVGPSGCGKTTLLGLYSGFYKPTHGTLTRTGRVSMVYQQDGLFPWYTVTENIAIGLNEVKDEAERARQLKEMVRLIGLEGFQNHYPYQLSGGMRQRVELARAMVSETDILLLDEPFSSLDYLTRLKMRRELARMVFERPRTVVLVTHDIEEAAQLADRVIVLSERPATIRRELHVALPRPRNFTHPDVMRVVTTTLAELGLEQELENVMAQSQNP